MTSPRSDIELAIVFARVARLLGADTDAQTTLEQVLLLAVATIDGAESAGVSLVRHGRVNPAAVTDQIPSVVDAIQSEVGEGPCLDAIVEHERFITGDLAAEDRWPSFARRAYAETGIQSILGIRLFVSDRTLGALNLYSSKRDAFDERAEAVGEVFAAHAALAMVNADERASLHEALGTREAIGHAVGILMFSRGLTAEAAFDALRVTSQRLNRKLRDVADEVSLTGEVPAA